MQIAGRRLQSVGGSASDRTYVARLIASQTGRKAAAKLSFWLAAAFLFGAFYGQLRDGTLEDRRLVPRAWL